MKTKLLLSIFPLLLFLLAFTPGAEAANQTVANLGDSGLSSQLRQKIALCQSGASPGGTITFSVAGTVMVDPTKGPLPAITKNVTINGAGKIEISGNTDIAVRIFDVNPGATLTLNNITVSHAYAGDDDGAAVRNYGTLNVSKSRFFYNATSPSWSGSAILSWGSLSISDSEFAHNSGGGGAVKPRSSEAVTTITNCNFHDNSSTGTAGGGYGGAMQIFDGPAATISQSVFRNNTAQNGGAIFISTNSSLVVRDSTFDRNSATGAGGAICNQSNVFLSGVTLSGNHADGGGGIYNNGVMIGTTIYYSLVTLSNITISENNAGTGGGIYNDSLGEANLTNVTLSGNSAAAGNGIYSYNATGATLKNTLIAHGTNGGNCATSSGRVAGSSNLSDDNTCGFTTPGDPLQRDNVTDLFLGSLADNGGPTLTYLPQPGSRAIDNGTSTDAPSIDQRGVERPQGPAADVGAVEVPLQVFENTNPSLQLGGWSGTGSPNANGGFFRWSNLTNTAVTYKFNATSIKWITAKGPTMGKALVTIDGVSKGTFDLYRSSMLWNQQILFSGLSSAAHTIVIKVTGTKHASATDYYVALDGFLVGSATKIVQESALAIQYDKWVGKTQTAASGGSYRLNTSTGDASFGFNGPAVNFVTARGPSYGKVNVIIDEFAVSSIVDLYAPNQQWQYAVEVSGLSNGFHTITIRPTHTKNANSSGYGVVLDAFEGIFNPGP
jgi:hypothetical protein